LKKPENMIANSSENGLYDVSPTTSQMRKFDLNLDTIYHDPVDIIQQQTEIGTMVLQNGQLTMMPWTDISFTSMYYEPGTYKYGSTTYVPSYTDSVYLSPS
jgi:hypothetical protein